MLVSWLRSSEVTPPSGFSSHTINKRPFRGLFSTIFCVFLHFCFLFGDFAVCNGPKRSAEVPSSVPQCKDAGWYLTEKTAVIHKLGSGMRHSGPGHGFNVNASTTYIKYGDFEQKYT